MDDHWRCSNSKNKDQWKFTYTMTTVKINNWGKINVYKTIRCPLTSSIYFKFTEFIDSVVLI